MARDRLGDRSDGRLGYWVRGSLREGLKVCRCRSRHRPQGKTTLWGRILGAHSGKQTFPNDRDGPRTTVKSSDDRFKIWILVLMRIPAVIMT